MNQSYEVVNADREEIEPSIPSQRLVQKVLKITNARKSMRMESKFDTPLTKS